MVGYYNETFGAASFLGIPYATPPLGKLRWQPSISAVDGNRSCTSLGLQLSQQHLLSVLSNYSWLLYLTFHAHSVEKAVGKGSLTRPLMDIGASS